MRPVRLSHPIVPAEARKNYTRDRQRLARGLSALGLSVGDRVGICAPNCAEWVLTQLAPASVWFWFPSTQPIERMNLAMSFD